MLWQRDLPVEALPLGWARAENAHGAEVYIRPARGFEWPLVFLDDVVTAIAVDAVNCHGGMAIQTSPEGGCHLWLPCGQALNEQARHKAQQWLSGRFQSDPGSVSGEHLGRLAGFKNWKRGGCWVNVLKVQGDPNTAGKVLEIPPEVLATPGARSPVATRPFSANVSGRIGGDTSPSGRDWGWTCRMLEAGHDPERVYLELLAMAQARRGPDAERYARRTVDRAIAMVRVRTSR
jgi:hypothetical protein